MNRFKEANSILIERFGRDSLISVATVDGNYPAVRTVNSYYEDGAFYVVTYALSNKMQQIEVNPNVAISGEWFTARGIGENMGYICARENEMIAKKLRKIFAEWYTNGHVNEEDFNTCILCIKLTNGVLFNSGVKFDIDFLNCETRTQI